MQKILPENPELNVSELGIDVTGLSDYPRLIEDLLQLRQMVEMLQRDTTELRAKRNLEVSLANFNDLMRWQATDNLNIWADRILQSLIPFLGALNGSIYVYQKNETAQTDKLVWIGGYAISQHYQTEIMMGQGLVGQVAKTQKPLYLDDLATLRVEMITGTAQVYPRVLLIHPLVHHDVLEGVVEISSIAAISEEKQSLIQGILKGMAAHLNTIQNQLRIEHLYRDAKEKSEQLIRQEEILRQNVQQLEAAQLQMKLAQVEIENRAHQLSESQIIAGVGSFEMVIDSNVVAWSENTYRLFGIEYGKVISRDFFKKLLHPDDLPKIQAILKSLRLKSDPVELEIRCYRGTQTIFMIMRAKLVRILETNQIRLVGTVQDITKRKENEAIIHQQNEELITREEEMRQNFEELQTIQESLRQKAAEVERLKQEEDQRQLEQKENLKRIMEKLVAKSTEKEAYYTQLILEKDAEINALKNNISSQVKAAKKSKPALNPKKKK